MKLTPHVLVVISFLFIIIVGAVVLALPVSIQNTGHISFIDSLFTATSATCVTGLSVVDTGSFFSPFGRWFILFLIQLGGLGIMTFSTVFAVMLGRKLGFYEADVIRGSLDKQNIFGFKKLLLAIFGITLALEVFGAFLLFLRWSLTTDWGFSETIKQAVFHSVSAFCNAGFSLFSDNLRQFGQDPYINFIFIMLIFLGGIGFLVIVEILGLFYRRGPRRRLSLQAKIALSVSAILIVFGAVLLFVFEKDNTLHGLMWPQRLMHSVFQSVTSRTAGFNTLDIESLVVPSKMILMFLMFIGASPGSTGGGIKTCTFAVIVMTVFSILRNRRRVMLFSRSVTRQATREAMVIFFLALTWIFVFTIFLVHQLTGVLSPDKLFVSSLFEVVSAFGTVGLSTGITSALNDASKVGIIVTMFVGRVGMLAVVLSMTFRKRRDAYIFPEEDIMVG